MNDYYTTFIIYSSSDANTDFKTLPFPCFLIYKLWTAHLELNISSYLWDFCNWNKFMMSKVLEHPQMTPSCRPVWKCVFPVRKLIQASSFALFVRTVLIWISFQDVFMSNLADYRRSKVQHQQLHSKQDKDNKIGYFVYSYHCKSQISFSNCEFTFLSVSVELSRPIGCLIWPFLWPE